MKKTKMNGKMKMNYKITQPELDKMNMIYNQREDIYNRACGWLQSYKKPTSKNIDRMLHVRFDLESENISVALIAYILYGDIKLFKRHVHLAAQLQLLPSEVNYISFGILDGDNYSSYTSGYNGMQYAILSDDFELANRCAELIYDLEEPRIRYSYMGSQWRIYGIKYLLLNDEESLEFIVNKLSELLSKKTISAYFKTWIKAFINIVNKDENLIRENLLALSKGFTKLGYAVPSEEKMICLDAVMFCKLARCRGIAIEIDTLRIPQNLIDESSFQKNTVLFTLEKPDLFENVMFTEDFEDYIKNEEKNALAGITKMMDSLLNNKRKRDMEYGTICASLWNFHKICAISGWIFRKDGIGFRTNMQHAAQALLPAIKFNRRDGGTFQNGAIFESAKIVSKKIISEKVLIQNIYFALLSDEESLIEECAKSSLLCYGYVLTSAAEAVEQYFLDIIKEMAKNTPEKASDSMNYLKRRMEKGMCTPYYESVVKVLDAIYLKDSEKVQQAIINFVHPHKKTIFDEFYNRDIPYEEQQLSIEGIALCKLAMLQGININIDIQQIPLELINIKKQEKDNIFECLPKNKLVIGQ